MTKTHTQINLTTISFSVMLALCAIALIFYIIQVGALAEEKQLIFEYEKQITALSKGNKNLDIRLSKDDSLSNIENHLTYKSFVKTNQVKYIQILRNSAVNR